MMGNLYPVAETAAVAIAGVAASVSVAAAAAVAAAVVCSCECTVMHVEDQQVLSCSSAHDSNGPILH